MKNYTEFPSIKRDCICYHNAGCRALDKTYCATENCKFYKNAKMLQDQIAKIRKRIPDYEYHGRNSDEYQW